MRKLGKKIGYYGAISTDFQMQLYFQNLGINSTQNSLAFHLSSSWVFSKQRARRKIKRPVF